MRKLTPIVLSDDQKKDLSKQLGVQEVVKGTPKSTDPVNYPVWSIPVGKKVLIYVPNHVVVDADGVTHLRMDEPFIHSLRKGKKQFFAHRCISGLDFPELGLNGVCPLCQGTSEPWDLANAIIEQRCKQQGLDPTNTDDQTVKNIRSTEFSNRVLKEAEKHYTFPIVVFDTVNDDAKTLVKDENGKAVYRIYWYDISQKLYDDKWLSAIEAYNDDLEDGEDPLLSPAGNYFVLNYIYKTDDNKPQNQRDAAKNLKVNVRKTAGASDGKKGGGGAKKMLDEATKDWTPEKARETVLANILYPENDLQEVADEVLEGTRNLLAMYSGGGAPALEAQKNFQLEEVPSENKGSGATMVTTDETDEDLPLE